MNKAELDYFYSSLAAILNTSVPDAYRLVHNFNRGDLDFFTGYFDNLPLLDLAAETTVNEGIAGEWGIVYTDRYMPFAYKVLFTENYGEEADGRLQYLKALFKEVIIQTLLQSDLRYGDHVCTLYGLYRTGAGEGLLKMEKLDLPLKQIIEAGPPAPDRAAFLLTAIIRMFEILIHFHAKYKFQHNDLHAGNIMLIGPVLKFIDFGNSSAKIQRVRLLDTSDAGIDDFNAFFDYPPVHVPAAVVALFEELAVLPEREPYETFLAKLMAARRGLSASRRRTTRKLKLS